MHVQYTDTTTDPHTRIVWDKVEIINDISSTLGDGLILYMYEEEITDSDYSPVKIWLDEVIDLVIYSNEGEYVA